MRYEPLVSMVVLAGLSPTCLWAQNNPNGWIQTHGWNMLFLDQLHGCAPSGGAWVLFQNWVSPHDVASEDPKGGDEWADIDFEPSGWRFGAVGFPNPTWMSKAFLEGRSIEIPTGDLVDFNAVVSAILGGEDPDNMLAVATTYVENTTGEPLVAQLCASSDDSLQVWVNNVAVASVSVCRFAEICTETHVLVLPPGVARSPRSSGKAWVAGASASASGNRARTTTLSMATAWSSSSALVREIRRWQGPRSSA